MIKYLFVLFLLATTLSCENSLLEKVKIFGTKDFVSSERKSSDDTAKSEMIYSFLKNHNVNTMTSDEINQLLGESTAYYEFPAYNLILNGTEYIVAFPVNRDTNKIRKYVFGPEL